MLSYLVMLSRSQVVIINETTAANKVIRVSSGDEIKIDLPDNKDAFIVTSKKIEKINVDNEEIKITKHGESLDALRIKGNTAEFKAESKMMISTRFISSSLCSNSSLYVAGEQYKFEVSKINSDEQFCVFPTFSTGGSVFSFEVKGGSAVIYQTADLTNSKNIKDDEETVFVAEQQPFIVVDKEVNNFELSGKTYEEDWFENKQFGTFNIVSSNGFVDESFPAKIKSSYDVSEEGNWWIVSLVCGILAIIGATIITVCAICCCMCCKKNKDQKPVQEEEIVADGVTVVKNPAEKTEYEVPLQYPYVA